jgi:uncharacterized protein YecE (DUF72 family)
MNAYRNLNAGTFVERVSLLRGRLGPIRAVVAAARDDGLLELLLGSFDSSTRLAFDFRHDSWDGIEHDLPPNAVRVGAFEGQAPFSYIRLREPPYEDTQLQELAGRLRPLLEDGREVYCYFRHEDAPTAPRYAARLIELLR